VDVHCAVVCHVLSDILRIQSGKLITVVSNMQLFLASDTTYFCVLVHMYQHFDQVYCQSWLCNHVISLIPSILQ